MSTKNFTMTVERCGRPDARVFNRRVDVFSFEKGVAGHDLFEACPIREKLKNIADANALAPNAGTASARAFIQGDSFQSVGVYSQ